MPDLGEVGERAISASFVTVFADFRPVWPPLLMEEEDGERKPEKRLDPLFFEDNKISDPEHQRL